MPDPHPLPSSDFNTRPLPTVELRDSWWRISKTKHGPSLYFGATGDCRFDAPSALFGVCYLARDLHGAFIEVFGRSLGVNLVTEHALHQRMAIEVDTTRSLTLVDLTGAGLAQIGADNRLATTGDYTLSQAWSQALQRHPDNIDGILYRSRHDPQRECLAAFNRCASSLEIQTHKGLMSSALRNQLATVIDHYEFALD